MCFCTEKELFNFPITLPLTKLDITGSRLVSNILIFPDDILVTFLWLSGIIGLSIGAKTRKFR